MTKVKICGLTTKVAVEAAVAAGADFLGFVFAPSRRRVTAELVVDITADVPAHVKKVGVFVSPTLQTLTKTAAAAKLDFVQIHGRVPAGLLPRALILATSDPIGEAERAEFILIDTPSVGKKFAGGNGETFPWTQTFPEPQHLPQEKLFVAGGLNADNVRQAIAYFQPYAVDVSSGVETLGEKDVTKIAAFIRAAKEEK